jgi:hypothetical protein
MSLAIEVGLVSHVLLADGWHAVHGNSFDLDSYEYHDRERPVLAGGSVGGVPSTGATWKESDGTTMACPMTAVLAVKIRAAT